MLILCDNLLDNFDRNITDSMQINSNESQQLTETRARKNGPGKKREQQKKAQYESAEDPPLHFFDKSVAMQCLI